MSDELREQLADEQHAIWSHWMKYMFSCGAYQSNGAWVMPAEKVERWQRQMDTPYDDLTDKEREFDRHQADKVLAVVQPELDQLRIALAAATQRAEAAEATANEYAEHIRSLRETVTAARAEFAAANARAKAAERERDLARRHVELLREELDAVPVAALDALLDTLPADCIWPAEIDSWLAWATIGAHWQPADGLCPDCGADTLALAVHADGKIEQWLCEECGYVAAQYR